MVDLHVHTTYSDGASSVKEVLKEAQNQELEIISITDHDCIEAYDELDKINVKEYYQGEIIVGCEFKCVYTKYGVPIEILGYGFDRNRVQEFLKYHSKIAIQEKYLGYIKKVGGELGLIFDKNITVSNTNNIYAGETFEREILKYPENIEILEKNNMVIEDDFYHDIQGDPNSIFYIDEIKDYPTPNEIIDLIHDAGGISFLAHPLRYQIDNKLKIVEEFINDYPIDGLECYHSLISEEESEELVKLCKKYNLFISGGSDFHGSNKPDVQMGTGRQNLKVEKNEVEDWINKIK